MKWRHWAWAVVVVVAVSVAYVFGRRDGTLADDLNTEIEVIEAKVKIKRAVVKLGANRARQQLRTKHAATIERFSKEQKDEADRLRNDHAALAAYYVRAARG